MLGRVVSLPLGFLLALLRYWLAVHQEEVAPSDFIDEPVGPVDRRIALLAEMVGSREVRLGYYDLISLAGTCRSLCQAVHHEILPLAGRISMQTGHNRAVITCEFLVEDGGLALLDLLALRPGGLSPEILGWLSHGLADVHAFRLVGRLLADHSSPRHPSSYTFPMATIISHFRRVRMTEAFANNTELVPCIKALLNHDISVGDVTISGLSLLFNWTAYDLAWRSNNLLAYTKLLDVFGVASESWTVEVGPFDDASLLMGMWHIRCARSSITITSSVISAA